MSENVRKRQRAFQPMVDIIVSNVQNVVCVSEDQTLIIVFAQYS